MEIMSELGISACVHISVGKSCETFQAGEKAVHMIDDHANKFKDGDKDKATLGICEQVARVIGYPQKPEGVTGEAHCSKITDSKSQGKAHQALKAYIILGKEELLDSKGENATCIARGPGESMCQAIRGYMAENGYTRLFVGAPAKCAGTTINRFFGFNTRRDSNASFCPNQLAIGGRHLYPDGSLEFTRAACSGTTLFIFTVRGKISWFESALRQVCTDPLIHCALENITKVVRRRLRELHAGPSDWIAEEDAVLKNVLLLDYAATTSLLDCLPPNGLRKDTKQSALDAIYSRAGRSGLPSIPKLNAKDNSDVYRDIAPSLLKVWDSVSKPFWPTPYVESMVHAGCSLVHFPKLL